jgi:hypothetical protein
MGWAGESCPVTQPKVGLEGHQTASLVLNSNLRMKRDVVLFLPFRSARVDQLFFSKRRCDKSIEMRNPPRSERENFIVVP